MHREKFELPKAEKQERPLTKVEMILGSENLRQQYEDQVRVLNELGIVELQKNGDLGFVDETGQVREVPKYEEVLEYIEARIDIIKKKYEQGFTELQLTPFGTPLDFLVDRVRDLILDKHAQGKVLPVSIGETQSELQNLGLDTGEPVSLHDYAKEYVKPGELVYYPNDYIDTHGGKTKAQILRSGGKKFNGWNIILMQDARSWFANVLINTKRKDIPVGLAPFEFLEGAKSAFNKGQYEHESFLTLEDYLTFFMFNLKHKSQVVGIGQRYAAKSSMLLGAYSPIDKSVPTLYWNQYFKKFVFNTAEVTSGSPSRAVRTGVVL